MSERELPKKPRGFSTLSVHGGEPRPKPASSLATPIVQTATFTFANTQELKDHFEGKIERVEYGRYGNPTQKIAENKLAALEGAEACLLFSSGMAAATTALFAMLSRGTHVVVTDDSYRRTRQFLNQTLSRYGIEVSTVPCGDYDALEDAIRPTTRALVSESPTNPYNRILDLERFADVCHALQPAAARVRRRPGDPLRHEVPRRSQRSAGRRDPGIPRPGRCGSRVARHHGRRSGSVRCLSPGTRAQDVRLAHRAPESERTGRRGVSRSAPARDHRP